MTTLERVFSKLDTEPPNGTAKPFDGNARIAVDTFNGIMAGLQLDLNPRDLVIVAQVLSPGEVELTWTDPPNNAGEYVVERSESYGGHAFEAIAQLSTQVRWYRDTNLPERTELRYRVVAINARGRVHSNIVEVRTAIVPYEGEETGNV